MEDAASRDISCKRHKVDPFRPKFIDFSKQLLDGGVQSISDCDAIGSKLRLQADLLSVQLIFLLREAVAAKSSTFDNASTKTRRRADYDTGNEDHEVDKRWLELYFSRIRTGDTHTLLELADSTNRQLVRMLEMFSRSSAEALRTISCAGARSIETQHLPAGNSSLCSISLTKSIQRATEAEMAEHESGGESVCRTRQYLRLIRPFSFPLKQAVLTEYHIEDMSQNIAVNAGGGKEASGHVYDYFDEWASEETLPGGPEQALRSQKDRGVLRALVLKKSSDLLLPLPGGVTPPSLQQLLLGLPCRQGLYPLPFAFVGSAVLVYTSTAVAQVRRRFDHWPFDCIVESDTRNAVRADQCSLGLKCHLLDLIAIVRPRNDHVGSMASLARCYALSLRALEDGGRAEREEHLNFGDDDLDVAVFDDWTTQRQPRGYNAFTSCTDSSPSPREEGDREALSSRRELFSYSHEPTTGVIEAYRDVGDNSVWSSVMDDRRRQFEDEPSHNNFCDYYHDQGNDDGTIVFGSVQAQPAEPKPAPMAILRARAAVNAIPLLPVWRMQKLLRAAMTAPPPVASTFRLEDVVSLEMAEKTYPDLSSAHARERYAKRAFVSLVFMADAFNKEMLTAAATAATEYDRDIERRFYQMRLTDNSSSSFCASSSSSNQQLVTRGHDFTISFTILNVIA